MSHQKLTISCLVEGDIISVQAWFGDIEMTIFCKSGLLFAKSKNGDVQFPIEKLDYFSNKKNRYSKWKYVGKSPYITEQYTDFEEVENTNQIKSNQLKFLNGYG